MPPTPTQSSAAEPSAAQVEAIAEETIRRLRAAPPLPHWQRRDRLDRILDPHDRVGVEDPLGYRRLGRHSYALRASPFMRNTVFGSDRTLWPWRAQWVTGGPLGSDPNGPSWTLFPWTRLKPWEWIETPEGRRLFIGIRGLNPTFVPWLQPLWEPPGIQYPPADLARLHRHPVNASGLVDVVYPDIDISAYAGLALPALDPAWDNRWGFLIGGGRIAPHFTMGSARPWTSPINGALFVALLGAYVGIQGEFGDRHGPSRLVLRLQAGYWRQQIGPIVGPRSAGSIVDQDFLEVRVKPAVRNMLTGKLVPLPGILEYLGRLSIRIPIHQSLYRFGPWLLGYVPPAWVQAIRDAGARLETQLPPPLVEAVRRLISRAIANAALAQAALEPDPAAVDLPGGLILPTRTRRTSPLATLLGIVSPGFARLANVFEDGPGGAAAADLAMAPAQRDAGRLGRARVAIEILEERMATIARWRDEESELEDQSARLLATLKRIRADDSAAARLDQEVATLTDRARAGRSALEAQVRDSVDKCFMGFPESDAAHVVVAGAIGCHVAARLREVLDEVSRRGIIPSDRPLLVRAIAGGLTPRVRAILGPTQHNWLVDEIVNPCWAIITLQDRARTFRQRAGELRLPDAEPRRQLSELRRSVEASVDRVQPALLAALRVATDTAGDPAEMAQTDELIRLAQVEVGIHAAARQRMEAELRAGAGHDSVLRDAIRSRVAGAQARAADELTVQLERSRALLQTVEWLSLDQENDLPLFSHDYRTGVLSRVVVTWLEDDHTLPALRHFLARMSPLDEVAEDPGRLAQLMALVKVQVDNHARLAQELEDAVHKAAAALDRIRPPSSAPAGVRQEDVATRSVTWGPRVPRRARLVSISRSAPVATPGGEAAGRLRR